MLEAVNVMHTSATGTGQRHETTKAVQPAAAMNRKTLALEVMFKSYLAHPYWPERERVISIQKSSGMNRQKSDDKRQAALKAQCDKEGITIAEFLELEKRASRQWYRADDDPTSEIIIPRHQVAGCLVETIGRSTKNLRGHFTKDSFRHHVQLSDLRTGKFERDGVFDRYVKLETSNMRSRQVNEYISDFLASGTVNVDVDVKVSDLSRLFAHAFAEIGVGAARKMGFGRGDLITLNEIAWPLEHDGYGPGDGVGGDTGFGHGDGDDLANDDGNDVDDGWGYGLVNGSDDDDDVVCCFDSDDDGAAEAVSKLPPGDGG